VEFTKEFQVLRNQKSCKELKKVKNFIFVASKLQLCQLEIPIFIYNIICQIILINTVSFLFCEFIRVTTEMMAKLLF